MKINHINNYNEEISKYKLLSSTAGVGAIINTKMGFNVIIHDVEQWEAIRKTQERIDFLEKNCDTTYPLKRSQYFQENISRDPHWDNKINFIDDLRFLQFLKKKYNYPTLELFVSIVDLTLNERYNSVADPQWDPNDRTQNDVNLLKLTIPASHFPKMFYNGLGDLRHISTWAKEAIKKADPKVGKIYSFAPPFDILKKEGEFYHIPLKQINLVLICPNGHLSEIPWSRYIQYRRVGSRTTPVDLFALDKCCSDPDLKWTESSTRSEGFSSVFIECRNCEKTTPGSSKVNLEGITNLKLICKGHKPWNILVDNHAINSSTRKRNDLENEPPESICDAREMQVALATANSIYFSNNTSSLFIPYTLPQSEESLIQDIVSELNEKFNKRNKGLEDDGDAPISRGSYAADFVNTERLVRMKWDIKFPNSSELEKYLPRIKTIFLGEAYESNQSIDDLVEEYRFQEYKVFHNNIEFRSPKERELEFKSVKIPESFKGFFDVISQVNSLKITSVQLNFSRVNPKPLPDPQLPETQGQSIHNTDRGNMRCLPAVQALGEGIFFSLDQEKLNSWIKEKGSSIFSEARSKVFSKSDHYQYQRDRIKSIEARFFVTHTLCHLLMKELEFSCGYPVASLKERLYISNRMAAFLILTSDGSEGSMGGLVSQLATDKLETLLLNALRRSEICSADPLCWEGDGSGLASLNLASCFSCSIVSETACEERNLCLDRRSLLDPEFGFLRDLI